MKELQILHIEHWSNFLLAFIPLFIAIDVVGILPIFMSLVDGIEKPQKTKIINQSVITALSVSIGFLAIGKFVFSVLGIEIYDFKMAGGLLLLGFAFLGERKEDDNPNYGSRSFGHSTCCRSCCFDLNHCNGGYLWLHSYRDFARGNSHHRMGCVSEV